MLKTIIKNIPFYKKLQKKFDNLQYQINSLTFENVSLKVRVNKISGNKIRVVFICHRPAVWGSLKTVYENMKNDSDFEVYILAIPNKKQLPDLGLNHEIYESEGAESFWTGDDVIYGYEYETQTWYDINKLKPSYIFIQQPYNICKPECLSSRYLFKIAKICYVSYFTFLSNKINDDVNDECNPTDFLQNLSFYFTQQKEDTQYIQNRMNLIGNTSCKVINTGYPCFDNLKNVRTISDNWNFPSENKFRLIWTPRWCTNEGNCNFFDYKDKLVDYCINNDDIDFIFRPHPQAFSNWLTTGEMTEDQILKYKQKYINTPNIKIDNQKNYLETFATSSCLVTDISSIIPEYFLTGKPIIYCNKKGSTNTFIKDQGYIKGFYWVENWNELHNVLEMLKNGSDPLRETRLELIKSEFNLSEKGAGYLIKKAIKEDYFNA